MVRVFAKRFVPGRAALMAWALWSLACLQASAQRPAGLEWEQWFFEQRLYGLGYLPEDALAKAIAQRDGQSAKEGIQVQSSSALALQPELSVQAQEGDAVEENAFTDAPWFSPGPRGIHSSLGDLVSGRTTSFAVDPLNPSTVYVAAAGGGVWKSPDRGARWVPLTDRLPSLASGAVAVDPFSGDVWYGTGELNFCRDCYYGAGIYRSSDGGANWTRVNPENFLSSPTSVIVFDHQNEGTVFIGRSTALWKSNDEGETWRPVLEGVVTDFALNPLDSSLAYAALGNFSGNPANGIYRSADGGETWAQLSTGLPEQASMGRIALAVSPSVASTVYALIARSDDFKLNGLFRSLDGGETWTRLDSVPEDLFTEDGLGQGLFNLLVEEDPRDPATLYVGGVNLWKSTDFGATWENLSEAGNLHEDPHDLVFDPAEPETFYLIGDSGVWRSSDGGRSFANLNHSLAITQFQTVGLHPANPALAVGGTQDNGTVLYRGGSLWEQGRPGDSGATFYDPFDPQTVYTVANRFSLRRSDDGGRTFSLIAEGLNLSDRVQFYPPFQPDPNQPGMLYFATQRVWQSRDRGELWEPLSGDLTTGGSATLTALAVAPGFSEVLYAGCSDGRVQITRDGGLTWTLAAALPNRFVTSIAIHPLSPEIAVIGLSGFGTGHVFRTEDFGATWEDISGNLPDIPVNAVLLDAASPETVYLGTDIGVFARLADGTWGSLQNGMPNAIVLGLTQNAATGLLVAATHGRGAFALATAEPAASAPHLDLFVNAAGLGVGPLAPGMLATVFGRNMANSAVPVTSPLPLPTALAGTTLFVNDIASPLFFVSPTQANFQVPYEATGPLLDVRLRTQAGEAAMLVPHSDASPGIFQSGATTGVIVHGNGVQVSESSPARPGEELTLFAGGLGLVDPPVASGGAPPFSPPAQTLLVPNVQVGGLPAEVRFSGLVPGLASLYQVKFVVPAGLSETVPVSLELNGIRSNSVLLSVRP